MGRSRLPDGFAIRPAAADDTVVLHSIEARASLLLASFGYPEIGRKPWPLDDFAAFLRAGDCIVAADPRGMPTGFAVADEFEGMFWLMELSVDPDFGCRGIGTALVDAIGELARERGLAAVGLSTFRDIPFNAPFYRRCGFETVPLERTGALIRHRIENEVPDGASLDDRVHMLRKL